MLVQEHMEGKGTHQNYDFDMASMERQKLGLVEFIKEGQHRTRDM